MSYTLGAKRRHVFLQVLVPACWPGVLDSLRIGVGWAWTYLIVAELVAADTGIGHVILQANRFLQTDVIIAGHRHDRSPRTAHRRRVPLALPRALPLRRAGRAMSSMQARNVSMTFQTRRGALHALDDVTLEIPDAHFTCLVGRLGVRQVDAAEHHGRPRRADGGRRAGRRARRSTAPARTAAWSSSPTRSTPG